MFVDTHCHLYLPEFHDDIGEVIDRAEKEGINRFYLPAIDRESEAALMALETRFPGKCFAMMGLHPTSVGADFQRDLHWVRTWLEKRSFAGVGEIGLDFYWDTTFKPQQVSAFEQQIDWALEFGKPVIIHSRNALDECIDIIQKRQNGRLRGIFHCFSGNLQQAQRIIDAGLFLGIGGVLTYKNSGLAEVISQISLAHVVLETDAPYLPPVPYRGRRNESSYIKYVVEKLALIKGVTTEEIGRTTTENAGKVFVA